MRGDRSDRNQTQDYRFFDHHYPRFYGYVCEDHDAIDSGRADERSIRGLQFAARSICNARRCMLDARAVIAAGLPALANALIGTANVDRRNGAMAVISIDGIVRYPQRASFGERCIYATARCAARGRCGMRARMPSTKARPETAPGAIEAPGAGSKTRADQVWIVFITLTGVMRSNSTVSGIAVAPGCAFR
ncbi:hypothetical protein [Burkholderia stagnalis]|uniref:hypothetical protein n=1 Tax=Burkholderia stagnalis TaxID=1503054 RepID=UPI00147927B2|nr:hypothetical protein [Burkholderia stagnalis]MDY7802412.1 hypothetical protein [Burkholderia stagnalis]